MHADKEMHESVKKKKIKKKDKLCEFFSDIQNRM